MEERFENFTVLINRISRNIRKIKNQEMEAYGLRSSHISCLYYLYTCKEMTSTELCERCEEDKATISRSIDYLEKNGYLCCESKTTKRYKSPLILTPKGVMVGEKIATKIHYVLDMVGEELSEKERLSFYRSLRRISDTLEQICENTKGNREE